jgi:hypothetical protein
MRYLVQTRDTAAHDGYSSDARIRSIFLLSRVICHEVLTIRCRGAVRRPNLPLRKSGSPGTAVVRTAAFYIVRTWQLDSGRPAERRPRAFPGNSR